MLSIGRIRYALNGDTTLHTLTLSSLAPIQNLPGPAPRRAERHTLLFLLHLSFVKHLLSPVDGATFPANERISTHRGRPLLVVYDLPAVSEALERVDFTERRSTMWRYRELLPMPNGADVADDSAIVTLGEGMTPLLPANRLGDRLGLDNVFIKDESQLPTGSFKSRGMSAAITMARSFGISRVALPTAGNAGGALAAYAARAGIEAFVFMPADSPQVNIFETKLAGAHVTLVDGLIGDCGRMVREGADTEGWFDFSTLREPYRLEGKKTMGFEIAEQFGWSLPDVVVVPTGGGTAVIGIWKAFVELAQLGLVDEDHLPRMVAVQSDGCCPLVRAFEADASTAEPFENPATIARGLRVPSTIGDFLVLNALRQSHGTAVAVDEKRIAGWMTEAASAEGVSMGPEGATCVGAIEHLRASKWIKRTDIVVMINTAAAQKTPTIIDEQEA